MARPSRSRAKVDFQDVVEFAEKLERTRALADAMRDDWENEWGRKWADEMKARVNIGPRGDRRSPASREYGPLRDAIQHVPAGGSQPGGIVFGNAFYWRFLEYGTSKMPPHPFIKPSMRKIRTPSRKDAAQRAVDLIRTGRV